VQTVELFHNPQNNGLRPPGSSEAEPCPRAYWAF
jgi:hypothetical protein